MSEMRYWLVTVDCHAADHPMVRMKILLQATDSEEAMKLGRVQAELEAAFGPKWTDFEVREATSQKLPWVVNRVQWAGPQLSKREKRAMKRGLRKARAEGSEGR